MTYQYNGSNQNDAGFNVPSVYFHAKALLQKNDSGTVLLIPPTTNNPYISTAWGYTGEVGFYTDFFSPSPVITLNNFGGTYSSSTQFQSYDNLTHPLIYNSASKTMELEPDYVHLLESYHVSYILVDSSIISGISVNMSYVHSLVNVLVQEHIAREIFNSSPLIILELSHYNV